MKRALAVLSLLCLVGSAWALSRRWTQSQALTATAPSVTCTGSSTSAACGLDIGTFRGFRVCVESAATATLTGGSVAIWYYDYDIAGWARNPLLDYTITGGQQRECTPDYRISVPRGRVLPNTSSVTVLGVDGGTGGSSVTVSAVGFYP